MTSETQGTQGTWTDRHPGPWAMAHRAEARRRLRELGGLMPYEMHADKLLRVASRGVRSAEIFWRAVARVFGHARATKELKRLRGLAEGRLVRETVWEIRSSKGGHVRHEDGFVHEGAARGALQRANAISVEAKRELPWHLVRIDRIRRAGKMPLVYVDNTVAVSGDGTIGRPFRTMAEAVFAAAEVATIAVCARGGGIFTMPPTTKRLSLQAWRIGEAPGAFAFVASKSPEKLLQCAECDLPIKLAEPEDDLPPGAYVHASSDDSDNCDADCGHNAAPREA